MNFFHITSQIHTFLIFYFVDQLTQAFDGTCEYHQLTAVVLVL